MKKTFVITATFAVAMVSMVNAYAGDLEWSGLYRAEGLVLTNTALDTETKDKSYGLHHLILKPRVVAADGLFINSRFDILNYDQNGTYPGSQHGQVFGNAETAATAPSDDDSLGQSGEQETLVITHLYMTLVQEFGSLVVGRVPLHFGLGMTHNAGNGLFDHWLDTRDLVGYKIVMGNFFLMPMLGKVNEGDLTGSDDVSDYMIQLQYESDETDTEMGLFYQVRKSGQSGNTMPTTIFGGEGGDTTSIDRGLDLETINLYYKKTNPESHWGFEASLHSGDTGVQNTTLAKKVDWESLGVAIDFGFRSGKWDWDFKMGYASGDDPDTEDSFEGYLFDRNYDVAMLMFNQELGAANYLRTALAGTNPGTGSDNRLDIETISNVTYFAPSVRYQWKDKYAIDMTIATGWLNQTIFAVGGAETDNSLGYEIDIALDYKPNDRLSWRNELGVLMPGAAFETDAAGNDVDTGTAIGFVTKAAISF